MNETIPAPTLNERAAAALADLAEARRLREAEQAIAYARQEREHQASNLAILMTALAIPFTPEDMDPDGVILVDDLAFRARRGEDHNRTYRLQLGRPCPDCGAWAWREIATPHDREYLPIVGSMLAQAASLCRTCTEARWESRQADLAAEYKAEKERQQEAWEAEEAARALARLTDGDLETDEDAAYEEAPPPAPRPASPFGEAAHAYLDALAAPSLDYLTTLALLDIALTLKAPNPTLAAVSEALETLNGLIEGKLLPALENLAGRR